MTERFTDRHDAGQRLAGELRAFAGRPDTLVLGLPRGGVPVAAEVAQALGAPLDVFVVRKLGVPGAEEMAMGAVAAGSAPVLDHRLIAEIGIAPTAVERVLAHERAEVDRRERQYRGGRPPIALAGRRVILVDDGMATGSTMLAAVLAVRTHRPKAIVVAVPVASAEACHLLHDHADACLCTRTPTPFHSVGEWYRDFTPTSDAEVERLLAAVAPAATLHHVDP